MSTPLCFHQLPQDVVDAVVRVTHPNAAPVTLIPLTELIRVSAARGLAAEVRRVSKGDKT